MKKSLIPLAALFLSATISAAGPKPQSGNILSHTSVACGSKKSKKQDVDLLCQQYVVRSGTTDYTIRQPKPSDQTIIPLNTAVEFTLDKDKVQGQRKIVRIHRRRSGRCIFGSRYTGRFRPRIASNSHGPYQSKYPRQRSRRERKLSVIGWKR